MNTTIPITIATAATTTSTIANTASTSVTTTTINASATTTTAVTVTENNTELKKSRFKVKNVAPEDAPIDPLNTSISKPKDAIAVIEKDKDAESKQFDNLMNSKKSRFTVKTVLKEDEKLVLTSSSNYSNMDTAVMLDHFMQQSHAIQKLEKFIENQNQILFRLLDSKNGNPNSHSQPDLITYQNKANDTDKVGVRESASALDKSSNSNAVVNPSVAATSASTNIQSSMNGGLDKEKDKDKSSFGKMSHYVNEMKKELDIFQKQRKEMQLEMQRLREKCQQLEDQLTVEQSKVVTLEERLERSKANQRNLLAQIDNQTLKLEKQQQTQAVVSPTGNVKTSAASTEVGTLHNLVATAATHGSNVKSDKPSESTQDAHSSQVRQLKPQLNKLPVKGALMSETKSSIVTQNQTTDASASENRPLQRSLSFDSH